MELSSRRPPMALSLVAWFALWEGPPDAVDRFLAAGNFSGPLGSCSESFIDGMGLTKLSDCRSGRDEWRRPGGDTIVRHLTRGVLDDGTYIVYLDSFAVPPATGTTG